ncbi:MAG TPA: hypothetical protein VK308_11485, partial [Pyrinomonadaceae bacterium]|nr:hypothetical protein [Pyrinomonadaceae bacterium]
MPANKNKETNYRTLSASKKKGGSDSGDQAALKPAINRKKDDLQVKDLVNPQNETKKEIPAEVISEDV